MKWLAYMKGRLFCYGEMSNLIHIWVQIQLTFLNTYQKKVVPFYFREIREIFDINGILI